MPFVVFPACCCWLLTAEIPNSADPRSDDEQHTARHARDEGISGEKSDDNAVVDSAALRPLVNESDDNEVVEDILQDLVADAEAYMSGFEVRLDHHTSSLTCSELQNDEVDCTMAYILTGVW